MSSDSIQLPQEIPIPELPGRSATRDGRIISYLVNVNKKWVVGHVPRELKLQPGTSGYLYFGVGRRKDISHRVPRKWYVHRVVAKLFLGPIPDGMEVCHKNGIKADNRADNLKFGTRLENMQDCLEHGTRRFGSRHQNSKLKESDVSAILERLATGERPRDIAISYGLCRAAIEFIRDGKRWPHVPRPAGFIQPTLAAASLRSTAF